MANDIAIRLSGVSKFYKLYNSPGDRLKEALHPFGKKYHNEFYALKNINLEIKKGEVLGIVGKNGSGKSTLLKLIAGVMGQSSGVIETNGHVSALLELGAGFNPQFTGIDNIKFYGMVLGLSEELIEDKLGEIVAFADIGDFINQPVKTYSSGMKSRLGFAVAAHSNADILILDEVLAVGDSLFRRKCYAKMEEHFSGGKTIIYVSHSANSVKELCSSSILLDEGKLLMKGKPSEVTKVYQKYIYAPSDRKNTVIDTALKEAERVKQQEFSEDNDKINNANGKIDYFIRDLIPKSTVEYRNRNIDIRDAKITTVNGEKVNVLGFGKKYIYTVKYVSYEEGDFEKITFGFAIKDSKGVRISAIESFKAYQQKVICEKISAGEEVILSYEFECRLSGGFYFVDTGLSSFSSGEQQVLNRVVDIISFQVVDPPNRVYGGVSPLVTNIKFSSRTENWTVNI